jgi:uncharacterized membrane protein (DUF2068 family)
MIVGRPLPVFLIAVEKAVSTVGLAVAAALVFFVRTRPEGNPVEAVFSRHVARNPHNQFVHWLALQVPALSRNLELVIGIGLVFWTLLFLAETIGVWRQAAWGELLVIFETAEFLPVTIWRLTRHPHGLEWLSVPINLLILAYLLHSYLRRRSGTKYTTPTLESARR